MGRGLIGFILLNGLLCTLSRFPLAHYRDRRIRGFGRRHKSYVVPRAGRAFGSCFRVGIILKIVLYHFRPLASGINILIRGICSTLIVFNILIILTITLRRFRNSRIRLCNFGGLVTGPYQWCRNINFLMMSATGRTSTLHLTLIMVLICTFGRLSSCFLIHSCRTRRFKFINSRVLHVFLSLRLSLLLALAPFGLPATLLYNSFLLICNFGFSNYIIIYHRRVFKASILQIARILARFFRRARVITPR